MQRRPDWIYSIQNSLDAEIDWSWGWLRQQECKINGREDEVWEVANIVIIINVGSQLFYVTCKATSIQEIKWISEPTTWRFYQRRSNTSLTPYFCQMSMFLDWLHRMIWLLVVIHTFDHQEHVAYSPRKKKLKRKNDCMWHEMISVWAFIRGFLLHKCCSIQTCRYIAHLPGGLRKNCLKIN